MNADFSKKHDFTAQLFILLQQIQSLQIEKAILKQKIKCKKLEKKKEAVCQFIQKLNINKDEKRTMSILNVWYEETKRLQQKASKEYHEITFHSCTYKEENTPRELNHRTELFTLCFLYKDYLWEIKTSHVSCLYMLSNKNSVCTEKVEDSTIKQHNNCKSSTNVASSIFVEGLEHCVMEHLENKSSFNDMFVNVTSCLESVM